MTTYFCHIHGSQRDARCYVCGEALPALVGSCATCRFAEAFEVSTGEFAAVDSDLQRRYPLTCQRAEMRGGEPMNQQTLAFTMDGSSYRASLLVAPEYGCVQWEAKLRA